MPLVSERGATASGHFRDLADVLIQVDKKKTWFKSAIGKEVEPMNTLVEWPLDDMPAVSTDGALDEADTNNYENAFPNYGMLKSYLQVWERKPKVGRLAQKVAKAAGIGKRKAMAKAIAKFLEVIARDIEATFLSDNETQEESGNAAYKTRGMLAWASNSAQSVLPVPEQFRTPAGAIYSSGIGALTEETFGDMAVARWDEVGEAEELTMAVGSTVKNTIAKWSIWTPDEASHTLVRRFNSSQAERLTRKVDIIEAEFGTFIIRASSFINASGDPTTAASKRLGVAFDMNRVKCKFAERPHYTPHEDKGGGPRGLIEAIGVLRPLNPKDLMKIAATA